MKIEQRIICTTGGGYIPQLFVQNAQVLRGGGQDRITPPFSSALTECVTHLRR